MPPGVVSPTKNLKKDNVGEEKGGGQNSDRSNVTCPQRSYISLHSTHSVDFRWANICAHIYLFSLLHQSSPSFLLPKVGGIVVDPDLGVTLFCETDLTWTKTDWKSNCC